MSQLNPNAAEFVPVSPTRSIPSPACRLLRDDVIAQSPKRPAEIDISVPNLQDFVSEAKSRPSDFEGYSNGHNSEGDQNSPMENILNGKNIDDIPEFLPGSNPNTPSKPPTNEEFHFGPNAAPFTPGKLLDQSEGAISTKAVFGDESAVNLDTSQDNVDFVIQNKPDPMSMSMYEDKNNSEADQLDLNEVRELPDNIDEYLSKPDDDKILPLNDTISDLPEHDPGKDLVANEIVLDNDERIQTTDLDKVDDEKELASLVSNDDEDSSGVCELSKSPQPQSDDLLLDDFVCNLPQKQLPDVCLLPESKVMDCKVDDTALFEDLVLQEHIEPKDDFVSKPTEELQHKEEALVEDLFEMNVVETVQTVNVDFICERPKELILEGKETESPIEDITSSIKDDINIPIEPVPASSPTEPISVGSPIEHIPLSSPIEAIPVSSPTEPISVGSPIETIPVSFLTEPIPVSSPIEPISFGSPIETIPVSFLTEPIPLSSPTELISVSSPTEPIPISSPIEPTSVSLNFAQEINSAVQSTLQECPSPVREDNLLPEICVLSTPKSVTDTESVATADVNSFLERSQMSDLASPLYSPGEATIVNELSRCVYPLPTEIETEIIAPEKVESVVILPEKEEISILSTQEKVPEVKIEDTAIVAGVVAATAALTAAAVPATTPKSRTPAKKPTTKLASKPLPASPKSTLTSKPKVTAKTTVTKTSTTAKVPLTKTATKPKTPNTTPRTSLEKKPVTNGDIKTAKAPTPKRSLELTRSLVTKTPTDSVPKASPTKPLVPRPTTAPSKTTTKLTPTTMKPKPTTLTKATSSAAPKVTSTTAKLTATRTVTATKAAPQPTTKLRPTTAPPKPRVSGTRASGDLEKLNKDNANKLTASRNVTSSRTTTTTTTTGTRTNTLRKVESKVSTGVTRTTASKSTTTTSRPGVVGKKPLNVTKTTTTKTTKIEKPVQNGVPTVVTEQITIVNNAVNASDTQLLKDNSPIDNKLIVDTNTAD